jgi:hypothetical protein
VAAITLPASNRSVWMTIWLNHSEWQLRVEWWGTLHYSIKLTFWIRSFQLIVPQAVVLSPTWEVHTSAFMRRVCLTILLAWASAEEWNGDFGWRGGIRNVENTHIWTCCVKHPRLMLNLTIRITTAWTSNFSINCSENYSIFDQKRYSYESFFNGRGKIAINFKVSCHWMGFQL